MRWVRSTGQAKRACGSNVGKAGSTAQHSTAAWRNEGGEEEVHNGYYYSTTNRPSLLLFSSSQRTLQRKDLSQNQSSVINHQATLDAAKKGT
jgi:hypothetical protein